MKKRSMLVWALVLALCLQITAFAAETQYSPGGYTAQVTGVYEPGSATTDTVFCVDIDWGEMRFTYHAKKAPQWDPAAHAYSESVDAHWSGEGVITVTNHSNAKITAAPTYTPAEGYTSATMAFSSTMLRIASAESGAAQVGTITVTPGGTLPAMDAPAAIGSITLTIAQDLSVTAEEMEALLSAATEFAAMARQNEALANALENNGYLLSSLETAIVDARNATSENRAQKYRTLQSFYNSCLEVANTY